MLASGSSRQTEIELGPVPRRVIVNGPIGIPLIEAFTVPRGGEAYLTYAGFPANFADGATIGPYLRLSQAEILVAIGALVAGAAEPGLREVTVAQRAELAELWLASYAAPSAG